MAAPEALTVEQDQWAAVVRAAVEMTVVAEEDAGLARAEEDWASVGRARGQAGVVVELVAVACVAEAARVVDSVGVVASPVGRRAAATMGMAMLVVEALALRVVCVAPAVA